MSSVGNKTNSLIDCCKDCVPPKRCIGCHGWCKDYKDAVAFNEQRKAQIRKAKALNNEFHAFKAQQFKMNAMR